MSSEARKQTFDITIKMVYLKKKNNNVCDVDFTISEKDGFLKHAPNVWRIFCSQ